MKHSAGSNLGYFITLEGIEGVGKSTSLAYLKKYLAEQQIPAVITREPGGTPIAESIRQVLLSQHAEPMVGDTELLLMFAGRAQHIANVIQPALLRGEWVVCDRFTDASYAYQGGGRGIASARIKVLEDWVQGDLQPDLTLLLDAPVELALNRAKKRATPDRFEQEAAEFFTRVRSCYLDRAHAYPDQFKIIDASCSETEVQQQIAEVMRQFIN